MVDCIEFFRINFTRCRRNDLINMLAGYAKDETYRYIVTPNTDHVVNYIQGGIDRDVYAGADVKICDSRILARLARICGKTIPVHAGSDVVVELLDDPRFEGMSVALVGPTRAQFDEVIALYPDKDLVFIDVPRVDVGTESWYHYVNDAANARWDVLLVCLSFPKQEYFACDIRRQRTAGGVALCVGAGIDFIVGAQKRAPKAMQSAGLEWLHRLASNPRRLWRRYLLDGPKIFRYFLTYELLGKKIPDVAMGVASLRKSRPHGE